MKLIFIFCVMQAAFIAAGCLIIFGGIFIEMLKNSPRITRIGTKKISEN